MIEGIAAHTLPPGLDLALKQEEQVPALQPKELSEHVAASSSGPFSCSETNVP